MSQPSGNAGEAIVVFLGWLLVVVGVLIAGLAGLCTLAMGSGSGPEARSLVLIGLAPMAVGGAILLAGLLVLRDRRRRRAAQASPSAYPVPTEAPDDH